MRRQPCVCGLLSAVALLLLTASVSSGSEQVAVLRLFAAPDHRSVDGGSCGSSPQSACALDIALQLAPPGTHIILLPGVYTGAYTVLSPVLLLGQPSESEPVVFDGEFARRPLTFDNVPAHVAHVHFRSGMGVQAGCVLVRRLSNYVAADANNFTRCVFTNCTGSGGDSEATDDGESAAGVAGAVAVFYRHSSGSTFEITRSHVEGNYARSAKYAAGGIAISYAPPTDDQPSFLTTTGHGDTEGGVTTTSSLRITSSYCNTMTLTVTQESLFHIGGTYKRVKGILYGNRPVWKSWSVSNVMFKNAQLTPHLIAYCSAAKTWHLVPTPPQMPVAKALAQHPPCTSSLLTSFTRNAQEGEHASPLSVTKWLLSNGNGGATEALRFVCQDSASYCSTVQVVNAVGGQVHRNGLYYPLNITRAGRPTFKKVFDGDKPQFIWYCAGPREWIVSDDHPANVKDDDAMCSRGIATVETLVMHPTLAPGWRFWDLDTWRSSLGRNSIRVTCAPPRVNLCQTVELVNSPMQDFHSGPYLLSNVTWNHRPTYTLRPPFVSHLWFCGSFNEWVVSETDPATLNPNDERCSRALSSHPTQSATPYQLTTTWAQYLDEEWVPTPSSVRLRCVDDCPRIVVDALGYHLGYKDYLGVYAAIGRLETSAKHGTTRFPRTVAGTGAGPRVYRKLFHSSDIFLYLNYVSRCWVISTSLDPHDVQSVFVEACGGAPAVSVFHASSWAYPAHIQMPVDTDSKTKSRVVDPQPTMSCDVHITCRRINLTAVLYVRQEYLLGVYEPLPALHNNRPMFLHNFSTQAHPSEPKLHFMYYCASFSKWVVGPEPPADGRCPAWIASKSTSSTHPLVNVHWVLSGDGVRWETSPVGVRMGCADDDYESTTSASSGDRGSNQPTAANTPHRNNNGHSSKNRNNKKKEETSSSTGVWDTFSECNFTGNTALTDSSAVAAGAVLLSYGRSEIGEDPTGYLRKSSLVKNEATAPQGAGGIAVQNPYTYRAPQWIWSDVVIAENRGSSGGAHLSSIKVNANRVQLRKNTGFGSGGGIKLQHQANFSGSVVSCRNNYAQRDGGCGSLDSGSSVSLWRSELVNNTALDNDGTTFRGGSVLVVDSKVLSVHHYAISACFLMLSSSELSCAAGTPASLTDGFGCLPDPLSPAGKAPGPSVRTPDSFHNAAGDADGGGAPAAASTEYTALATDVFLVAIVAGAAWWVFRLFSARKESPHKKGGKR